MILEFYKKLELKNLEDFAKLGCPSCNEKLSLYTDYSSVWDRGSSSLRCYECRFFVWFGHFSDIYLESIDWKDYSIYLSAARQDIFWSRNCPGDTRVESPVIDVRKWINKFQKILLLED